MKESTQTDFKPDYAPHARAERLIASGRFVLAFSSLVAVYLEPSTPARYQDTTYTLLVVYTVYALGLVLLAWRFAVPSRLWRLLSHGLDLVLFSVFIYLTEGPASPFFLYFVFSLFCATLRFSWKGILGTGAAAVIIYAAMGLLTIHEPSFEVSRFLIREVYIGVIAALLVYLGLYQQRLRAELASLAAWPRELAPDLPVLLGTTMAHAAVVLHTSRLLLAWEDSEEPWVYTATWRDGGLQLGRIAPPGPDDPMLPEHLRNTSFLIRTGIDTLLVYDPRRSSVEVRAENGIAGPIRRIFADEPAMVVAMSTENVAAYLFVPDVRAATVDDLALAHIAGRLVLATLEQYFFMQQIRQTASAEERMRISRELHDGIVQSLGGVGLQLKGIAAHVAEGSEASQLLRLVQDVIEHDQRELRLIVRELRPHDVRDGTTVIADELQRIRERFPLEWGLEIDVEISLPQHLPPGVAHEVCRIVNESLFNAARHGKASRARVLLCAEPDAVQIFVSDNGCGFSFTGSYDLDALERDSIGPRTLKERVKALYGTLTIESSAIGAVIEARIPIGEGMA